MAISYRGEGGVGGVRGGGSMGSTPKRVPKKAFYTKAELAAKKAQKPAAKPAKVVKINSGNTTPTKPKAKVSPSVKVVQSEGSYSYVDSSGKVFPNRSLNTPGQGKGPTVKINSAPKPTADAARAANARALKAANKKKK